MKTLQDYGLASQLTINMKAAEIMDDSAYYYVYILRSGPYPEKHYSGLTKNLSARLKKHNDGVCSHTAKYRPWRIETAIAFSDKEKAITFEKYIKSGSGREFCRRHF